MTGIIQNGYRCVMVKGHPRASRDGYVREHILVCEKALGKPLPLSAEPHHVNRDRADNSPGNLVLCQDRAYHALLHQRQRALIASGHAGWRKCVHCKRYDDPANLSFSESLRANRDSRPAPRVYHKTCAAAYQRQLTSRRST